MLGPTRLEYENAFYHVMNRGEGRQTIFPGDRYYQLFLDAIAEAHVRFSCLIVSFITHQICKQKKKDRNFAIELEGLMVFIMEKLT